MTPKVFLLSPASLHGVRARQLASPRATFDLARRYRSADGVPVGDAFAFLSSLYFRGKITYARRFSEPAAEPGAAGVRVITAGYGLVAPDWALTEARLERMRTIDVDLASAAYVDPLREHAEELAATLPDDARVVLLGSVATGKYVDVLRPLLGDRLCFPADFAGLGDMARGGLLLRAARAGTELAYVGLDANRRRPPGATGKMPPLPGG